MAERLPSMKRARWKRAHPALVAVAADEADTAADGEAGNASLKKSPLAGLFLFLQKRVGRATIDDDEIYLSKPPMVEVARVFKAELEAEEIRKAAANLRALLEPPWHLTPASQIHHEAYADDSPEGRAHLEQEKYNQLRRNWFTTVLLIVDGACDYLPHAQREVFLTRSARLKKTVRKTEKTTVELVQETEALAREVIAALEGILRPMQPPRVREAPPPQSP